MIRSAVISDDGVYRYRLYRQWANNNLLPIMWVMLNPSTADGTEDDPTIKRCIAFSQAWGYDSMYVGNLYAIRSTDPSILGRVSYHDARGPDYVEHMLAMRNDSARIVAAWGNPGGAYVPQGLRSADGLWCLGLTKHCAPRHPLYLPKSTPLVRFRA